jgi:ankyrin repeat protein
LISLGAPVNHKDKKEGETPLHLATMFGFYDVVKYFLSRYLGKREGREREEEEGEGGGRE